MQMRKSFRHFFFVLFLARHRHRKLPPTRITSHQFYLSLETLLIASMSAIFGFVVTSHHWQITTIFLVTKKTQLRKGLSISVNSHRDKVLHLSMAFKRNANHLRYICGTEWNSHLSWCPGLKIKPEKKAQSVMTKIWNRKWNSVVHKKRTTGFLISEWHADRYNCCLAS